MSRKNFKLKDYNMIEFLSKKQQVLHLIENSNNKNSNYRTVQHRLYSNQKTFDKSIIVKNRYTRDIVSNSTGISEKNNRFIP